MQFTPKAKRQELSLSRKRDVTLYPHAVQFYKYPPNDVISLEEFEELALERLKVLRLIERAGAKYNKMSNDYKAMVNGDLRKMKLPHYYSSTKNENVVDRDIIYKGRRRDHISHFILRLAYCRREDLRRWFIAQEVDLFRYRFNYEKSEFKKSFMELNGLSYDEVSEEETKALENYLQIGNLTVVQVNNSKFYKVPFTEVLDLVKCRRVYLNQGYAYITEKDFVLTVLSAYRTHLSHALAVTFRALPQLQEDTRLISMLATLHQRYIGTDYSKRRVDFTGEITPEQIDDLTKTSFPLCMRNLHEVLRKNHHLKYNGRLQYGLFLKGIGLSLEDALRFWRDEFTKIMDVDKFDKQYSYNIRYNYGKEGKRANFSPYSCMKIIMSNSPGPGEYHGCPFKHSDESNLRQKLQSLHINNDGIKNVVELASKGHYQIACTRCFELTHNEAVPDQGISHPNHYFEESRKILLGIKKDDKHSNNAQNSSASTPKASSQKSVTDNSMEFESANTPSQQSFANNDTNDVEFDSTDDIEELLFNLKGV